MWSSSEKDLGCFDETAVVSWIDAPAGSLDEVTKNVVSLWLVEREEFSMWSDDVSSVDGFEDSLFQSVNILIELVTDVGNVNWSTWTSREFKTIDVLEMGFVWDV